MKRLIYLLSLALLMPAMALAQTHTLKWLRVNNLHHKVMNTGYQGESAGGRWGQHAWYYFDSFRRPNMVSRAFHVGVKNWTDPEGKTWPVRTAGAAIWGTSPKETVMPVPLDAEGNTIKRYFRTKPTEVTVGDFILSEPFPLPGDEIAPDKIPGTADVMVESRIRLPLGIEIHQRVLAWTQKNHDDYLIFDWTFTNTGNVDLDDEIELPQQVLEDVYLMRGFDARPSGEYIPWWSYYGAFPEDSLRVIYAYNEWRTDAAYDDFGRPSLAHGYLGGPVHVGEAFIHVDESVDNPADDPSQPFMTGHNSMELNWFKTAAENASEEQWKTLYQAMSEGFGPLFGSEVMEGTYPNGKHMPPMDVWATARNLDTPQAVNYQWHPAGFVSFGPYTMQPGDDFRIVWATTFGSISPEKAWEIGQQWFNKDPGLTWEGPNNLPPPHEIVYPKINPQPWDIAKDHWVATGKDSLFQNAWNAQWAVRNDYNVPIAPAAPASFTVTPQPDRIVLSWDGTESEKAPDFAGYRIYRAAGNPGPIVRESRFLGSWELVHEIQGKGTYEWADETAERGQAYYYYITAFDNGQDNPRDATGRHEVLESGKYLTMTGQPAHLTRAPGNSLTDVRVVPNPFNRRAESLQFVGEPDKLMFMNLPPECTIRIYTESGDLVKVIEHTDGSGDEAWGDIEREHSVTETGQVIVSGLYVAYIQTPSGESTTVKFVVVR